MNSNYNSQEKNQQEDIYRLNLVSAVDDQGNLLTPVYSKPNELKPLGTYVDDNGKPIRTPEEEARFQVYCDKNGEAYKNIDIKKDASNIIQVTCFPNETPANLPDTAVQPIFESLPRLIEVSDTQETSTNVYLPDVFNQIASISNMLLNSLTYELNDSGNINRVLDVIKDDLIFIKEWKQFRFYTGTHWQKVDDLAVMRTCKKIMQKYHSEAQKSGDKDIISHARSSCNNKSLRDLCQLLKVELGVSLNNIPRSTNFLCVKNGIVDLTTGQISRHEDFRNYYFMSLIDANYTPNSYSANWDKFLNEVFVNNAEKKLYMQKAIGYAMIGNPTEQCMFILVGTGANGKSTLLAILQNLIGSDLTVRIPINVLTSKSDSNRANAPTPEIAKLEGIRLAITSEASERDHLSEAQFKAIVGSHVVTARRLHKDSREFQAEFTFFMDTNRLPKLKEGGHSVFRRIKIIRFPATFEEDSLNRNIVEEFNNPYDRDAIISWIIDGAVLFCQEGLTDTAEMREEMQQYKADQNTVEAFLRECTIEGHGYYEKSSVLYEKYRKFCDYNFHDAKSLRDFGLILKGKLKHKRSNSGSVYEVRLIDNI